MWKGGLRVWFALANKSVTVNDERSPCLLSLLYPLPPEIYIDSNIFLKL